MAELFGRQFQVVFENSPIGIVIMDGTGQIQYTNRSVVEFLGYSEEELAGGYLTRYSLEEDSEFLQTLFAELVEGERDEFQMVSRCKRKNGETSWWRVDMRSVHTSSQSPFILGVIDDVTSQKHDEDRLRRAKELAEAATRTKSAFLANMSHEIRTPLHTINGMTELLRQTEMDEEQTEYVQQIQFAGEVLLGLINDILDFSKIEAGRLQLESIPFDIVHTLEDAVDMVSMQAHRKGLETVLFIDPELCRAMTGDPNRIRQVIVNLVNNAVKFTEKGYVKVSADLRRQKGVARLVVQVRDTGIGIPEELRDRLFRAFSQVDASMTRRYGGTGLGLSISRDLVEMMGGKIGVKSKPGVGSNFWFSLPLDSVGLERAAVDRPRSLPEDSSVLIIDDNDESSAGLERYFHEWGVAVVRARNSRSGIAELERAIEEQSKLALVLIDLRLPEMDGWQLASEIRNKPGLENQSLILMSPMGLSSGDAKMKLLRWFDAYINKPIKRDELATAIERIFSTEIEELEAIEPGDDASKNTLSHSSEVPKTVLVAEDHFVNQQLFQTILEKRGFTVVLASDGLEALQQVRTEPDVGLIFMDVQMPNLNGFDATRRIREMGIETPIVAVTANALSGDRERILRVGMDEYIAKPFKIGDIDEVVERLKNAGKFGPRTGDAPRAKEPVEIQPAEPKAQERPSVSDAEETNLDYLDDEPGEAPSEELPIDVKETIEAFMGDVAIAERVVREFAARLPEQIEQVRGYITSGEIGDARVIAHAIKGGAWNLNSNPLGNAAREVEDACRDEDAQRALQLLPEVSRQAQVFAEYVGPFDFSQFS